MTKTNLSDIFSPKVNIDAPTNGPLEIYRPSPKKGKNGVYNSVVRFVPWHSSPSNSIIEKRVGYITNPITNMGKYVDCPSTVGDPSIILDTFRVLRNSDSVVKQEQSKVFSTKKTYFTLVQIIKDENAPELVGKILVWSFGMKIFEKISAAMNPTKLDDDLADEGFNPFDIFDGRPFQINVKMVSDYPNYDGCAFMSKPYPLFIVEGNKKSSVTKDMDQQRILDFLVANSPDLEKYKFKPWDKETKAFVEQTVSYHCGGTMAQVQSNPSIPQVAVIGVHPIASSGSESIESYDNTSLDGGDGLGVDLSDVDDILADL